TVIDLGGGSLQVSRIDDGAVTGVASLPLGAVRLTRKFVRADPPTNAAIAAIRRETATHLAGLLPPASSHTLIGIGGTIRALARIHLAAEGRRREVHGLKLPAETIGDLCAMLRRMSPARRRRVKGLRAERADIIVAGAVVLDELLRHGGHRALTVCARGVRHG